MIIYYLLGSSIYQIGVTDLSPSFSAPNITSSKMSSATLSIPIQPLRKNQTIESWRRTYQASVALLDEKQALALLPSYVCRTKGDQILAEVAAKETTLTKALDQLQVLIDGETTEFTWMNKFCEASPIDTSISSQTAFFFELTQIAANAGFPPEKAVIRFLNVVPSGKNIYQKMKSEIKEGMADTSIFLLFKKMQPMLKEKENQDTQESGIKNEMESFMAYPESTEVIKLREKVQLLEDKFNQQMASAETENYCPNEKFQNDNRKKMRVMKCKICGRKGHEDTSCWKRTCKNCSGQGHDEDVCPSKKFSKGSNL